MEGGRQVEGEVVESVALCGSNQLRIDIFEKTPFLMLETALPYFLEKNLVRGEKIVFFFAIYKFTNKKIEFLPCY